ncbi:unnamed protein product [Caenorhabditis brenneri]
MTTLNELSDVYIDEFIAKFKEDISQKPSQSRSPTASAEKSEKSGKSTVIPAKIDFSNLPCSFEIAFYS